LRGLCEDLPASIFEFGLLRASRGRITRKGEVQLPHTDVDECNAPVFDN
jgi:hypothetical protein